MTLETLLTGTTATDLAEIELMLLNIFKMNIQVNLTNMLEDNHGLEVQTKTIEKLLNVITTMVSLLFTRTSITHMFKRNHTTKNTITRSIITTSITMI